MAKGRFAKLFGVAREYGLEIDDLRELARQLTGEPSLKSLSPRQEKQMFAMLAQQNKGLRKYVEHHFKDAPIYGNQRAFLIDLIVDVFKGNMKNFRGWLKRYHGIDHESKLDGDNAVGVINALNIMRERNYSIK